MGGRLDPWKCHLRSLMPRRLNNSAGVTLLAIITVIDTILIAPSVTPSQSTLPRWLELCNRSRDRGKDNENIKLFDDHSSTWTCGLRVTTLLVMATCMHAEEDKVLPPDLSCGAKERLLRHFCAFCPNPWDRFPTWDKGKW